MDRSEIWIGNDHGGYRLKLRLTEHLESLGIPVRNVGSDSEDIVRYPYYAAKVAAAVSSGVSNRGILICSTGIGMSIAANRFKGVRASLCTDANAARLTRAHNDSNILVLGGKTTEEEDAVGILDAWLAAEFEGGRHSISLGLIEEMEESLHTSGKWDPEGTR